MTDLHRLSIRELSEGLNKGSIFITRIDRTLFKTYCQIDPKVKVM